MKTGQIFGLETLNSTNRKHASINKVTLCLKNFQNRRHVNNFILLQKLTITETKEGTAFFFSLFFSFTNSISFIKSKQMQHCSRTRSFEMFKIHTAQHIYPVSFKLMSSNHDNKEIRVHFKKIIIYMHQRLIKTALSIPPLCHLPP